MFNYLKKFVNVLLGASADSKLKPYWHHAELKEMSKKTEKNVFYCKKCGTSFFNKNYHGNYPLCNKHMLKEVK